MLDNFFASASGLIRSQRVVFQRPGPCSIGLGGWPMPHDGTVFWPHLKGSYDPTGCSGDYRVWRLRDVSFLGIAGAYVLHLQSHGLLDAVSIINEQGMGPLVAQVIAELPFKWLILGVVAVLSIIFYATTFDSAAYVLASICTHDLAPNRDPPQGSLDLGVGFRLRRLA
ncbi:MAG: hypothetical protein CM15mP74_14350 [Halieaceae bacterium]|nr:MAG: hypothetical protein CM15mP74_14350 [Halieaceae bacterium]